MEKVYTAVSLFAGAGGMDMGFERQGFKTIWVNDIDQDACATHYSWSKTQVECEDISKISLGVIPDSTIILGGFPCQGFSLAGPRKINDDRNKLYKFFTQLVELKQPAAFVAENVKGILTLGDGQVLDAILNDFAEKGYNVVYKLVNAADYGVPQDRERVIFVGLRKDLEYSFEFPKPLDHRVFIKDVLSDLPEPEEEDICSAPYSSRYMSRNRRRDWTDVSYTIPAMAKQVPLHPSSPEMSKISRDLWQFGDTGVTRRYSWQEAAAIQTFPQELQFVGDLTSKYKQIGNAVPVVLAEAIARELNVTLKNLGV